MNGDERPSLAGARVVRRDGDSRLLRGLTIAVAVGIVAAVVLRSRVAAAFVGAALMVNWAYRLFHRVLASDAEQDLQPLAPLPKGDREYSYRPRELGGGVFLGVILACAMMIASPSFGWVSISAGLLVTACAIVVTIGVLLRQRILLTDTHVIVPRSRWSREEVSLPLSSIQVRVWGNQDNPNVEISTSDQKRDFGMSFLGEANFRELVRLLEYRSAKIEGEDGDRDPRVQSS